MTPFVWPALLMLAGFVVLVSGGEVLVRGASALAAAMRISPLVIGLTVVAFGTSAPELAVSLKSCLTGQTELAVGNVVGSNICNVLLVLGVASIVAPVRVSAQLVRLDVPLMIAASLLLFAVGADGRIGRIDGLLMFACLVIYIVWSVRQSRRETPPVQQEFEKRAPPPRTETAQLAMRVGMVLVGLALLTGGAELLVRGAVSIAQQLGMSTLLIGLTIVALGTSLPEVVTAVLATLRKEGDIAVGNVVGSNLMNILCVLALSAIVAPRGIPVAAGALQFDIPVMIAAAIACLPVFFTGAEVSRWEGMVFVGYYAAYMTYLTLSATGSMLARNFEMVMLFVMPLTVITLVVTMVRSFRDGGREVAQREADEAERGAQNAERGTVEEDRGTRSAELGTDDGENRAEG